MSTESPVVRRCIAVASHGRRCQQSPFRGSPYCWHHLQSRKVPAPSRLRTATPTVTQSPESDRLPSIDPLSTAMQLVRAMDRETLAALAAFVGRSRDEAITLRRTAGAVAVVNRSEVAARASAGR